MLKDSFSIDPSASLKLRAQAAGVVVAWKTATLLVERQAEAEATNEVRDAAKPIPSTDYIAMRQAFAAKFGDLEDRHIPAKEYTSATRSTSSGTTATASAPVRTRAR